MQYTIMILVGYPNFLKESSSTQVWGENTTRYMWFKLFSQRQLSLLVLAPQEVLVNKVQNYVTLVTKVKLMNNITLLKGAIANKEPNVNQSKLKTWTLSITSSWSYVLHRKTCNNDLLLINNHRVQFFFHSHAWVCQTSNRASYICWIDIANNSFWFLKFQNINSFRILTSRFC